MVKVTENPSPKSVTFGRAGKKVPKIGGSRRRSGGEGGKMGEADVLMPEKVVESLLGENGDLIQVEDQMVVVVVMLILSADSERTPTLYQQG